MKAYRQIKMTSSLSDAGVLSRNIFNHFPIVSFPRSAVTDVEKYHPIYLALDPHSSILPLKKKYVTILYMIPHLTWKERFVPS